jgi:hypothetical protein
MQDQIQTVTNQSTAWPVENSVPQSEALRLIGLSELMQITRGNSQIKVGLIDGPVLTPELFPAFENIDSENGDPYAMQASRSQFLGACSLAARHGTLVASILSGNPFADLPAICPGCSVILRSISSEPIDPMYPTPSARPPELARAIRECIEEGANIIHLGAFLSRDNVIRSERDVEEALDLAAARGILVVTSVENRSASGSTAITRHRAVVPVVPCDYQGQRIGDRNYGISLSRRGVSAPGMRFDALNGLDYSVLDNDTMASTWLTGTLALIWSEFPTAISSHIKLALALAHPQRRMEVVPPLLNAMAIYREMKSFFLPKFS